jgi:hypothetical protein
MPTQRDHTGIVTIAGVPLPTYRYLLEFSKAHEGPIPFMYNNWPVKNAKKDVTAGVGIAITDRDEAAKDEIRLLFRLKGTNSIPTPEQMWAEFDRVNGTKRTNDNLDTEFGAKATMLIPPDLLIKSLEAKMLVCWNQRGALLLEFDRIQAQAQVALMSWNYGMRLINRPAMCDAVAAEDYFKAAELCPVLGTPGWDPKKNQAHQRLFENAGLIMMGSKDLNLLPPATGPFKPPPTAPFPFTIPRTMPLIPGLHF